MNENHKVVEYWQRSVNRNQYILVYELYYYLVTAVHS